MRLKIFVLAAALALAAGCNKGPDPEKAAASADKAPSQPQVNTPTTPAAPASGGATAASPAEKKEGANPVQQQVDPKQPEQRRDFQQKGDSAGPKGPDTAPKQGN